MIWDVLTLMWRYCNVVSLLQDKYVLAAMILLTAVCVWHAVTSVIISDVGDTIETVALVFFLGTYFMFNLIFVVRIYMLVSTVIVCYRYEIEMWKFGTWWCHMEKLYALPNLCEGNPPVTSRFPIQRSVFDFCKPDQTVEPTIELSVILSSTLASMWH